jgi:hypothetical protein
VKLPSAVVQWSFAGKPGNIKSQNSYSTAGAGNGYAMLCDDNKQYLTYAKTNVGINLGYKKTADDHKVHFRLPDGKARDILTGEKVALGIGGGDAFLRYAERTAGINLTWAGDPSFEWRIYDASGRKGESLRIGSPMAIINENVRPEADFLVYLDRPAGADIGWTTSPDWKRKLAGWVTDKAFTALVTTLV